MGRIRIPWRCCFYDLCRIFSAKLWEEDLDTNFANIENSRLYTDVDRSSQLSISLSHLVWMVFRGTSSTINYRFPKDRNTIRLDNLSRSVGFWRMSFVIGVGVVLILVLDTNYIGGIVEKSKLCWRSRYWVITTSFFVFNFSFFVFRFFRFSVFRFSVFVFALIRSIFIRFNMLIFGYLFPSGTAVGKITPSTHLAYINIKIYLKLLLPE